MKDKKQNKKQVEKYCNNNKEKIRCGNLVIVNGELKCKLFHNAPVRFFPATKLALRLKRCLRAEVKMEL